MYRPTTLKPFNSQVQNVEPRLAELSLSAGQGSTPQSVTVVCDVRFSRARQALTDVTVYAAISHAELSLHSIPPNVEVRTRFADRVNQDEATTERTVANRTKQKSRIFGGGKAALGPTGVSPNVSAGAEGERSAEREEEEKTSTKAIRAVVRARGDLTWSIGEHDDHTPLQGLYVGNDPLCIADCAKEFDEIEIRVSVPRSNFIVEKVTDNLTGKTIPLDTGKKKLINILAAKSVSKHGDALVICSGKLKPNV